MPNSALRDDVSQLRPALHMIEDWAYPDGFDHALYEAFMKTPHDVGGEPDAPAKFDGRSTTAFPRTRPATPALHEAVPTAGPGVSGHYRVASCSRRAAPATGVALRRRGVISLGGDLR